MSRRPTGSHQIAAFCAPSTGQRRNWEWTARNAEGIYDKRHVFFEAAPLIEYLFFPFSKNLTGVQCCKRKQRKEQAESDFYLFVLTASLSEILLFAPSPF